MSVINIAGIIFLVMVIVVCVSMKRYTRRKLEEIDGLGKVHGEEDNHTIAL